MVLLQDPLGIARKSILIPPEITPLLMLCDGSRKIDEIRDDMARLYGFNLDLPEIHAWLELFDDAAMLQNENFRTQKAEAVQAYRKRQYRPMTLSDDIYPADRVALKQVLDPYLSQAELWEADEITGIICPHIDYYRGWRVYAQVMANARHAIRSAELIIILGTDHFDDGNPISLTLQNYQTPFGIMKTQSEMATALSREISEVDMFNGELRHRFEHSIELALVWLHHMRDGDVCDVLPVLCGAHDLFFDAGLTIEHPWVSKFVDKVVDLAKNQRTLIVAAADLAHVGLAFDGEAVPHNGRAAIAEADERLLQHVKDGSPAAFIKEITDVKDRNNVCGTTPIYLLLRLLGSPRGKVVGYELCPADQDRTSWVSICGALFTQ